MSEGGSQGGEAGGCVVGREGERKRQGGEEGSSVRARAREDWSKTTCLFSTKCVLYRMHSVCVLYLRERERPCRRRHAYHQGAVLAPM